MRLWALLAPLGSLAPGAPVGPTSRAWFEELRLAPVVADALRARGLDEAAAWWAAERVRVLVDLPLRVAGGRTADDRAARLVEAWLAHPADPRRSCGSTPGTAWSGSTASRGGAGRVGGPAGAGGDARARSGRCARSSAASARRADS